MGNGKFKTQISQGIPSWEFPCRNHYTRRLERLEEKIKNPTKKDDISEISSTKLHLIHVEVVLKYQMYFASTTFHKFESWSQIKKADDFTMKRTRTPRFNAIFVHNYDSSSSLVRFVPSTLAVPRQSLEATYLVELSTAVKQIVNVIKMKTKSGLKCQHCDTRIRSTNYRDFQRHEELCETYKDYIRKESDSFHCLICDRLFKEQPKIFLHLSLKHFKTFSRSLEYCFLTILVTHPVRK